MAALTNESFTYDARRRSSVVTPTSEPIAAQVIRSEAPRWKRLTVGFATTTALLAARRGVHAASSFLGWFSVSAFEAACELHCHGMPLVL